MSVETSFEALDNIDHEFNVLRAAVSGLIEEAEFDPQSTGDQVVTGVNYQLDRMNKAIEAAFESRREGKAAA